ncbi:MAG: DMT family transporter [Fusobacteriaceae bacterium]|nr:DMT family transporter [Fusobacteriaceae bacterium]
MEKDDKNKKMTNPVIIFLIASMCCILWGSAFPAIKIGYKIFSISPNDTFSQIVFAGYRFLLAGILTILFGSVMSKKILIPSKENIGMIMKVSIFQTILQYFCFYVGIAHTAGVKGSIISALNVSISIILASLVFHLEKLSKRKIIGSIMGFLGVVIINLNGNSIESGISFLGEGMLFLSGVAYGFSSNLIKIYNKDENPILISGYQFVIGGAVLIVVGYIFGGGIHFSTMSSIYLYSYLGLLSAIAYTGWAVLLKYNPVSKVSVYGFLTPTCGFILSGIVLGELKQAFNVFSLMALILVSLGIIIINKK